MTFMERARALYDRGDIVRTAFVLAEGVKRDPTREEALNWFLQLYVEELEGPGLEQELIRLVESQPDGDTLLTAVRGELRERQQHDRVSYLDRVQQLRQRAAKARAEVESARDDSGRRRRGRGRAESESDLLLGEPEDVSALLESVDLSAERVRRRRRRQRREAESVAQGVLPLDAGESRSGHRDAWSGFKGVAAHLDPESLPLHVDRRSQAHAEGPEETSEHSQVPSSSRSDESCDGLTGAPSGARRDASTGGRASSNQVQNPRIRRVMPAFDQLLALEEDDGWSFGEPGESSGRTLEDLPSPTRPADELPEPIRRRLRRTRPNPLTRAAPIVLASINRGTRWIVSGKRGPIMLLLVALVGAAGVGYRACTGFVAGQLEKADEMMARGDGDGYRQALAIYDEHAPTDDLERVERAQFARAVLALDYGDEPVAIEAADPAATAWGGAAGTLGRLAEGNLALARTLADEGVDRFPESWQMHWARAQVAVAERRWPPALEDLQEARRLDEHAVPALIGLIDLALRSGQDERATALLSDLEGLAPEHPFLAVGRAVLAYGIDPLRGRATSLDLTLPDPSSTSLSHRTRELLGYIRGRQALAAWHLDRVGQIMRELREEQGSQLGVRTHLLEALLAARRYRLEEASQALERAFGGVPEGSAAAAVVRHDAALVFADLGRPDLALTALGEGPADELLRARLLVEAGREADALGLLGQLLDRPGTQAGALRILVDFHLRRGVPDRARLRAGGVQEAADRAHVAARLAADDRNWDDVRDHADEALRRDPTDLDSLFLWTHSTAELGSAERAIERIDEAASHSLLVGAFDQGRLDVLVTSGRAPRATVAEFVTLLQSTEPTAISRLTTLALGYEAIGDLDRALDAARRVIDAEPNNRHIHALLGRIYHDAGQRDESSQHLRAYLALAPETEPTDWARALLGGDE